MNRPLDPGHAEIRRVLRMVGPTVLVVGLVFVIVGLVDFFSAFAGFGRPEKFWCLFVGMPLAAVGLAISKFAFLGAVTRYVANEVAPVGTETFNYVADGTKDAVRELASAVAEGLDRDVATAGSGSRACRSCATENYGSANFCKSCGAPLQESKACLACGEANDADATYCNHCGKPVA